MSHYFTRDDRDQLIYYQVPKVLIVGEAYRDMKPNTKLVYILLLDQVKLSMQNDWQDDGKYYVRLGAEKAEELLGMSSSTFKRCKKELADYGLLEEERDGLTRANKLFPLKLTYTDDDLIKVNSDTETAIKEDMDHAAQVNDNNMQLDKAPSLKCQNDLSGDEVTLNSLEGSNWSEQRVKMTHQEGSKRTTNKNNYINNNLSNNNDNKSVNKLVNKETVINDIRNDEDEVTIHKLTNEYRLKGLNKDIVLRVVKEVMNNRSEIKNLGGYLRSCLETTLYRTRAKKGEVTYEEKQEYIDRVFGMG